MIGSSDTAAWTAAIAASWDRCARQYKLRRDAGNPIMRLQSSEIAPRLEQIVERTGGRQGHFRQLASAAGEVGHCLVVTDADGVLVRLETGRSESSTGEWNGIALGSCWDERIAGTNGVSMALRTGQAVTVRGVDHYYTQLRQFACTGIPVLDAHGKTIGAINLVSLDRGNRADYLFGQHLIAAAAQRIQRGLFETEFADAMLVSISATGSRPVFASDALIAVDDAGVILGATSAVRALVGDRLPTGLKGKAFDAIFDIDGDALARVPERVLSIPGVHGSALSLSVRMPGVARHQFATAAIAGKAERPRRLAPSLRQLAIGSQSMAAACKQAEAMFRNGASLVVEGETGTGKSALVDALLAVQGADAPVLRIDCASLGEAKAERKRFRSILEQMRMLAARPDDRARATLVLDNVGEMPRTAQADLRLYLDEIENGNNMPAGTPAAKPPRIVSTTKAPLAKAVRDGRFRDDLYYLLTAAEIALPPLRAREHPEVLAQVLASRIADRMVEISAEATEVIRAYPFPGNVREMRSALERAVLTAEGGRITPVDLRLTPFTTGRPAARSRRTGAGANLRPAYDERTLLLDALSGSRWNVSEAARRLGIGRATINRKIKLHGLVRPS